MAATLTVLQPGIRYKVTKNGGSTTTVAKAAGVAIVPPAGVLRAVGDTVTVADGLLYVNQPIEASIDNGTVVPTDGSATVLAGATAALRRIINTTTTTAAPTLATDGYLVDGYTSATFVIQTAGNVNFHLYGYDSNSGLWVKCLGADGFGDAGGDVTVNNTSQRVTYNLDYKGIERLYLEVYSNAGSAQVSVWMKITPPRTSF